MPSAESENYADNICRLCGALPCDQTSRPYSCPRCDDTGTKDHAHFAMEPCDNPDCKFGRQNNRELREALSNAITMLYTHGAITGSERDNARKRLRAAA